MHKHKINNNTILEPKKVFIFSGHMIDAKDRKKVRFPENKVVAARKKILETLEELGAGPKDLAFTQGACGGDILFTEACQELGVNVVWLQPFDEPIFLKKSILFCGDIWKERYDICKNKLFEKIKSASHELGEISEDKEILNSYARCNNWLYDTASSYGIAKVNFITLWDGKSGDAPGGTAHMYQEVKNKTDNVNWININTL